MTTIRVAVPATTANLGPGFDSLGLALDLWNQFEATVDALPHQAGAAASPHPSNGESGRTSGSSPGLSGQVARFPTLVRTICVGEGDGELPSGEDNLVFKAICKGLEGDDGYDGRLSLTITNRVPLSSGLGSSATAIVAGLLIGNALRRNPLSKDELLNRAAAMEGHPDNVAAALLGGLTVCATRRDGTVDAISTRVPEQLRVTVAVPDFYLGTRDARGALPNRVSLQDAVFNLSRAALWVAAAVSGRFDALDTATEDALHQPYRSPLIPGLSEVFAAAKEAGAAGIALSGSGPSVAAFSTPEATDAIGEAMRVAFRRVGVTARIFSMQPSKQGATIEVDGEPAGQARWVHSDTQLAGGQ